MNRPTIRAKFGVIEYESAINRLREEWLALEGKIRVKSGTLEKYGII